MYSIAQWVCVLALSLYDCNYMFHVPHNGIDLC